VLVAGAGVGARSQLPVALLVYRVGWVTQKRPGARGRRLVFGAWSLISQDVLETETQNAETARPLLGGPWELEVTRSWKYEVHSIHNTQYQGAVQSGNRNREQGGDSWVPLGSRLLPFVSWARCPARSFLGLRLRRMCIGQKRRGALRAVALLCKLH
jgi:hypothetical protein